MVHRLLLGIILLSLVGTFTPLHLVAAQDDDLDALKRDVVENYANIVFASYEDSYLLAVELDAAIDAFVAVPSEETLLAAHTAWLAAREPYGQTEAFRFYAGPIDDANGPEGLINAWPLDEAYIDYVDGQPDVGIINDLENYPELNAELLEELNESGAEENISVGFHAIEFLLWGQDLYEDSAGQRPYTDYVVDGTAANQERRAQYLVLVTHALLDHLEAMKDAWSPEIEDNYRAEFLALDSDTALQRILIGIGVLSKAELAGERIFTAYDNQDQEDEHSCFSDNTHRDIVNNFKGIQNVYVGQYTRVDETVIEGAGVADLLEAVAPEINTVILGLLKDTETAISEIEAPFDRAIVEDESREQVLNTVFLLFDLGDMIGEAAVALDITISTELPE